MLLANVTSSSLLSRAQPVFLLCSAMVKYITIRERNLTVIYRKVAVLLVRVGRQENKRPPVRQPLKS